MTIFSGLKAMWRGAMGLDGPLRLPRMLEKHGAAMAMDSRAAIYEGAAAVRRCEYCAQKEACDAWLASGAVSGVEHFCPNADYLRRRASQVNASSSA